MRIRLSENFRAAFYAPFYATRELGHFAAEGIDLELVASDTPGKATAGLADGSLDVTWGGPMRAMKSRNEPHGVQLVCFCEVVRRDPFYLVGRPRQTPFDLSELPLLRFASVSEVPTPWLCLQHDLREKGIDPASLQRVTGRSMAANLSDLAAGRLDVAQMFEPYVSEAIRTGVGQILLAASSRGETSYTTFLATPESMVRNRAAFAAMTRAVARTQHWMASHDAGALADAVAAYYPGVPREDLVMAYQRYIAAKLWADDTVVSRAGYDRLAQSLRSGGFIHRIPPYEDCVQNLV